MQTGSDPGPTFLFLLPGRDWDELVNMYVGTEHPSWLGWYLAPTAGDNVSIYAQRVPALSAAWPDSTSTGRVHRHSLHFTDGSRLLEDALGSRLLEDALVLTYLSWL